VGHRRGPHHRPWTPLGASAETNTDAMPPDQGTGSPAVGPAVPGPLSHCRRQAPRLCPGLCPGLCCAWAAACRSPIHCSRRSRPLRRQGPSCTRSRTSGPTCHPRSMSFYDTCVAPRYRNGPPGRRRLTGAEAFELEGMDPCYIDIDGFWPKGADSKGLESVPITN
jgi:hypothetical protein